jgi:hypothetical protein
MEPLGCLLLGLAVAGPAALVAKAIITSGEPRRTMPGDDRLRRQWIAPVSACDPKAVVEYFGSWPFRSPAESARFLSVTDFISLLGGARKNGAAPIVRFNAEGGFIDRPM